MMSYLDHHHRRRRRRNDHHVITAVMITMILTAVVAASDYPSHSEQGHELYSKKSRESGARPVVGVGGGSGRRGGGSDGYISDWNRDWGLSGNPNPGKCIDIPSNMTLCGNIGYDQMRLPNLLEHDTLKEVSQQASSWVRLLAVRCHPDTQVFLCSLFAPVCLDRPIWPCRTLCESVKAGCEDRMLKYGFPWPEMLRCSQFPEEDDLCIGLRNENTKDGDSACSACQSDTFESTVDQYCRAEFVMRVKVKQAIVTGSDLKIDTERKKKLFKTGPLKSTELRDSSLFIVKGSSCDCPALDNSGGSGAGKGKNSSNFVVMGNLVDGRLVVSFLYRIDKKSKEVNRALKMAKKPEICSKSVVIESNKSGATPSEVKSGSRAGNHAKGKKSSRGKEARVKGTPITTKPTITTTTTKTSTTTTTAITDRRKSHHANRANKKQQKKTETTGPQVQFY